MTFSCVIGLPAPIIRQPSSQVIRRRHSSASGSASGGSSPHSPYQVMTHAPALPSPLFQAQLTEWEIQIIKLKETLKKYNLGKKQRMWLSQGSGAVKIC